ncbi:class I SAM-dependent methyltransferase [Hyphomicrobium facile]|uniref:Methyltransferase domain-containing protein n=1 Tax=Hyphomicrobium facile TaxID=51670 RepID=A0A1I7NT42_9HYPH|nr:class I SAM-dependent methyltransferase [Hyphomicrobium facile]SFV37841.1 Methyltransferase domain-containing protein [Hyphomicrobium facile]
MTKDSDAVVRSKFGPAAADYATSEVHAKGESLARIVELVAPQKTWVALDVATGAGHTAAVFAPHVATVIASDITDEMLKEAAKLATARGLANMSTATASASALPFPNESFDLVCCRLAAHHFPDLEKFVAEVRRVLKKGGRFALVDNVAPDQERLPGASVSDIDETIRTYNAFEKLRDPSHGFAPPPEHWCDLLRAAGFEIVAHEQMEKELAFEPWVERMRCTPAVIADLKRILDSGPGHLRSFLKPRLDENGALHFTLQELLLVTDRTDPTE